jgi:hypothetical protein
LEISYHICPAAFVKVEVELEDRALEFGRVVEKPDSDDSGVPHLEAFRRD